MRRKNKDSDLEHIYATVLSETFSSGTKFTENDCYGDHSYHGDLWDYRQWGYGIQVLDGKKLDEKVRGITYLEVLAAFVVSAGTDVPKESLVARSSEELNKAASKRPSISVGDKIEIVFSKKDLLSGTYPHFLYHLGPDKPGDDTPNVEEIYRV